MIDSLIISPLFSSLNPSVHSPSALSVQPPGSQSLSSPPVLGPDSIDTKFDLNFGLKTCLRFSLRFPRTQRKKAQKRVFYVDYVMESQAVFHAKIEANFFLVECRPLQCKRPLLLSECVANPSLPLVRSLAAAGWGSGSLGIGGFLCSRRRLPPPLPPHGGARAARLVLPPRRRPMISISRTKGRAENHLWFHCRRRSSSRQDGGRICPRHFTRHFCVEKLLDCARATRHGLWQ